MSRPIINAPAPNTPYFTPAQIPAAGTAVNPQPDGRPILKPFQPLKIRGLEFHNRIWLPPLCQYSAEDGKMTPWHTAHLGGILTRGPGLTFVEATAVTPEGRITPQDLGLWSDDQVEPLRALVEFAHSQNQKIALQLAHAGRKASTVAPWLHAGLSAPREDGGWPDNVVAPSAIPFNKDFPQPRALTKAEIKALVVAYADAAKRALKAGVDVLEVHGAHGYLLTEFLSPHTNKRTDEYGGSFENRTRFPLEVVDAVRAVMPEDMPLFFRISGTEWLEHLDEPSWTVEDTKRFTPLLAAHGVDLLDISSAGNSPQQRLSLLNAFADGEPAPQSRLSQAVREHVQASLKTSSPITVAGTDEPLLISAVGGINTGPLAQQILDEGRADAIFVGRYLQQNPGLVWQMARELEITIHNTHQIEWGFGGRGGAMRRREEKGGHDANVPTTKEKA